MKNSVLNFLEMQTETRRNELLSRAVMLHCHVCSLGTAADCDQDWVDLPPKSMAKWVQLALNLEGVFASPQHEIPPLQEKISLLIEAIDLLMDGGKLSRALTVKECMNIRTMLKEMVSS